jgi:GNAT superfamily N-acetyltransferase
VKPRVEGGGRLWMTYGKLAAVTGYQRHARNAAAMWEALSKGHGAVLAGTKRVRIVAPSPYHALRAIILDPVTDWPETIEAIVDTVLARSSFARRVVEDVSGAVDLTPYGLELRFRLTVMERPAGPYAANGPRSGVQVTAVGDPESLAAAEQILISVFPPPSTPDDPRGRIQPPRVLGIPGWRVWLARREGVPAGAAYTYRDRTSLGVYQVSTLPEHRGHGVGRALMTEILRAHPDVPVNLSATEPGRSLYSTLGFVVLSEARWWRPSHTGDDIGEVLR